MPVGVYMAAYADDLTIVVKASSRAGIERDAQSVIQDVSLWGTRNRLEFSAAKSSTVTLKDKFKRPPSWPF